MKILNIIAWGDIDYEDYGVCSRCRKELYCCSCDGWTVDVVVEFFKGLKGDTNE